VKAYGEMKLWVHSFLIWALDKGDYLRYLLADRLSGKSPLGAGLPPQPVWTLWRRDVSYACRQLNLNSSAVQPTAYCLGYIIRAVDAPIQMHMHVTYSLPSSPYLI